MPPPTTITYSKKGRRGTKLVSNVSSARLRGDSDTGKRRLPRSVSAADIRHPHLDHYTSFDPIDEISDTDLTATTASHCRATAAGRSEESRNWGAGPGDQPRCSRDHDIAQVPIHGNATGAQQFSHGSYSTARQKHLPSSQTSDFNFLSPLPAPLPRSMTAALSPLPKYVELPPRISPDPLEAYYDPDVVNSKVATMLAATEALKPEAPAPGTKTQAMKNKVLSRMASLFGRSPSRKPRKNITEDNVSQFGIGSIDPYPTILQRSRPSSTNPPKIPDKDKEARTKHLHSPTEQKIPRKPVPNNGRHLLAHYAQTHGSPLITGMSSASVASGEDGPYLPPAEIQRELRDWSGICEVNETGGCGEFFTKIADPFESELSFDNLEGFLTTQPLASSTPRDRGTHRKNPSADDSPSKKRFHTPGRLSYFSANEADDEADDELTNNDGKRSHFREKQEKRPAKPVLRLQRGSENTVLDIDDIEPKKTKIHPSPSKASLEELSRQFRALIPEPADQDELALNDADLSPTTTALPCDAGMLQASQTSALGTADYHDFISSNARTSTRERRITGRLRTVTPLTRAPSSRQVRRMGEVVLPTRPLESGDTSAWPGRPPSNDLDELQWDDETYRHQLQSA